MFLHMSACPQGVGVVSQHAGVWPGGLQAHTWGRGSPGPHLGQGVARPTPGAGGPQAHTQGVSRPTPEGVSRSTPRGVSRSTPRGVSRPTPRGLSQHALRQILPYRQLLLRAVRILLECILVIGCVWLPLATTA